MGHDGGCSERHERHGREHIVRVVVVVGVGFGDGLRSGRLGNWGVVATRIVEALLEELRV